MSVNPFLKKSTKVIRFDQITSTMPTGPSPFQPNDQNVDNNTPSHNGKIKQPPTTASTTQPKPMFSHTSSSVGEAATSHVIDSSKKPHEQAAGFRKAMNAINRLYLTIRDPCQRIVEVFKIPPQPKSGGFQLTTHLIKRMEHGLAWYSPRHNPSLSRLEKILERHPLWPAIKEVMVQLKVDVLIGFYLTKEALFNLKILGQRPKSFSFRVERVQNVTTVISQARQFMEKDKLILLSCYQFIFKSKISIQNPHLIPPWLQQNALRFCLSCLNTETTEIKKAFVSLFIMYWKIRDEIELITPEIRKLREGLLKVELQNRLRLGVLELGIEASLERGQLRQEDLEGVYKDIYKVVISEVDIDWPSALERIEQLESLAAIWVKKLSIMVEKISQKPQPQLSLQKGLYMLKLILLLSQTDSSGSLEELKHSLLRLYSRTGNITLCLHLAQHHSNAINIHWLIPTLPTVRPSSLAIHPALPTVSASSLVLNLTQRVFMVLIRSKDIQTLTRYLSKGLSHFQEDPSQHLPTRIVNYYSQLHRMHPQAHSEIQSQVIKLLKVLEKQGVQVGEAVERMGNQWGEMNVGEMILKQVEFVAEVGGTAEENMSVWIQKWLRQLEFQDRPNKGQLLVSLITVLGRALLLSNKEIYNVILEEVATIHYSTLFDYIQDRSPPFPLLVQFYLAEEWRIASGLLPSSPSQSNLAQLHQTFKVVLKQLPLQGSQFSSLTPPQQIQLIHHLHAPTHFNLRHYESLSRTQRVPSQFMADMISKYLSKPLKQVSVDAITVLYILVQYSDIIRSLTVQKFLPLVPQVICQNLNRVQAHHLLALNLSLLSNPSRLSTSLHRTTLLLCLKTYKTQPPTPFIYNLLLQLLIHNPNSLHYSHHLSLLSLAQSQKILEDHAVKITPYCLYLLCIYLTHLQQQPVSLDERKSRVEFVANLRLFGAMIKHVVKAEQTPNIETFVKECSVQYLSKFASLLQSCHLETLIQPEVIQLTQDFMSTLSLIPPSNDSHPDLSDRLKGILDSQRRIQKHFLPITAEQKRNQQLYFEDQIKRFVSQLTDEQSQIHKEQIIDQLHALIDANNGKRINQLTLTPYIVSGIRSLSVLLKLDCMLIALLGIYYPAKCFLPCSDLEQTIIAVLGSHGSYLKTGSSSLSHLPLLQLWQGFLILTNRVTSTRLVPHLNLFPTIEPILNQICAHLSPMLQHWPSPDIQHNLASILQTTTLPIKYKLHSCSIEPEKVTLWNVIDLREKLKLAVEVINCIQNYNGLFQMPQTAAETVMALIVSATKNQRSLKEPESQLKMQQAQKLLELCEPQNTTMSLLKGELSGGHILKLSKQIYESIQTINIDPTREQIIVMENTSRLSGQLI